MTATFGEATDEILTFFKTAWDTTGNLAVYENVKGVVPTAQDAWARPVVRHDPGGESTLSDGTGNQRFTRNGTLFVSIFIPNGKGLSLGYSLSKIVVDAYDGKATASQVWFRNVRVREVGPSGEWYQLNVIVEFTYDELK